MGCMVDADDITLVFAAVFLQTTLFAQNMILLLILKSHLYNVVGKDHNVAFDS